MIFMKVGTHAGESFDSILQRKQQEYKDTGCIFWGYGGAACHPLKQVRPFVTRTIKKNGSIYLFMEPINSKANPILMPAVEYSEDGVIWKPIPKGITVTGSKYALILDEIRPGDLEIPLSEYEVGIGPSAGNPANNYIKGHVDKACLVRRPYLPPQEQYIKKVAFSAKVLDPYAVLLR
jgi:hypothetical protein